MTDSQFGIGFVQQVRRVVGTYWQLIFMVVMVYGALCAYLYFNQANMLYLPSLPTRSVDASPADMGMEFDSVKLLTGDGVKLDAWYVPAESARGAVLFCHGNAGNISHRLDSIKLFNELGLSVLIFDYRGYGRSEGVPSEEGTYEDAEAAWDYLTQVEGVAPNRIVFFGRSLGASIAAKTASEFAGAALIVESAFTSVPNMAAELYPYFPVRWLSRYRYETQRYMQASGAMPKLVIHSPGDEIIPFSQGQRLFNTAPEPKQMLKISGGHNDGFYVSGQHYVDGIDSFLTKYLSQ